MVLNISADMEPFLSAGHNVTDFDECNISSSWEWLYTIQPSYMAVICILGLFGNSLVLCVFCLHHKHSTVADVYLSNLAMADLIMAVCLPFWVVTVAHEFNWLFGELLCKLVNTAITMNFYCSVMFLMAVSMDRYIALVKSMSFGRRRDPTLAKRICWAIWLVGFFLSVPVLYFRSVKMVPALQVTACIFEFNHQGWRVELNVMTNIVGFLLPIPILTFCGYHIISVLKENQLSRFPREQTERKASCLVLVVFIAYVICLLPHQIVKFLDTLDYYKVVTGCVWSHWLDIGTQIATYLAYGNSSINPFLYVIVGSHFRKRVRLMFKQALRRGLKDKASLCTQTLNSTKLSHSSKISLEHIKL